METNENTCRQPFYISFAGATIFLYHRTHFSLSTHPAPLHRAGSVGWCRMVPDGLVDGDTADGLVDGDTAAPADAHCTAEPRVTPAAGLTARYSPGRGFTSLQR